MSLSTIEAESPMIKVIRKTANMNITGLVTDETLLRKSCRPVESSENAQNIIKQLEEELSHRSGVGLAAPQIGMLSQIAIIRLEDVKIDIINPTNVELSDGDFIYEGEGCLSFPGIRKNTKRSRSINFINNFGSESHFYSVDYSSSGEDKFKNPLFVVAIQHEIDHLFGKLFVDHEFLSSVKLNYVGRNDLCPCGSKKKYKKCCLKIKEQ
mgnify:CR=1 FL=1